MIKRIGIVVLVLLIFALMLWFTSLNRGTMPVDLAFAVVEPTVALALSVTFVLGWCFGILCVGFYILRLLAERRRLRHELKQSQSEVSSLRSLPIADAD